MLKIALIFIALGLIAKQIDAQSFCTPNPCANGGTCSTTGGTGGTGFTCTCPTNYVGSRCQLASPCNSSPCGGNGACYPYIQTFSGVEYASFYCNCYSGFAGTTCQTVVSSGPCSSNPCLNNGVCTTSGSTWTCTCTGPYTGPQCGTYVDLCANNQCQNNAICQPNWVGQTYNCSCVNGFYGVYCENQINNCLVNSGGQLASPCLNNGTCLNLVDNYVCQCVSPYTGTNCETYVNPCNSSPCGSGAVCTPSTTSSTGYTCSCATGYFGNPCIPNPCNSNPCLLPTSTCVPIQPTTTVIPGGCTCPSNTAAYVCVCPGSNPQYAGNC